jgi:hypothetical protein
VLVTTSTDRDQVVCRQVGGLVAWPSPTWAPVAVLGAVCLDHSLAALLLGVADGSFGTLAGLAVGAPGDTPLCPDEPPARLAR